MAETLVAFLCATGSSCTKALDAYLVYNKNPKIWAKRTLNSTEKAAEIILPREAIIGAGVLANIATHKRYEIGLTRGFSLELSEQKGLLLFTKGF